VREARAVSAGCVSRQRDLRDEQERPLDITQGSVEPTGFVIEDAKIHQALHDLGEPLRLILK
jgi:hypothetical protein